MPERSKPSSYFSPKGRSAGSGPSHLISIRLSDDLLRRLAAVGNDEGLAMSDTIRLVLERGLASKPNSRRGTTK